MNLFEKSKKIQEEKKQGVLREFERLGDSILKVLQKYTLMSLNVIIDKDYKKIYLGSYLDFAFDNIPNIVSRYDLSKTYDDFMNDFAYFLYKNTDLKIEENNDSMRLQVSIEYFDPFE